MKYDLVGVDGNAYSVMGYVVRAMRNEHLSIEEQNNYKTQAMSGDYDNLLIESVKMIDKLNGEFDDEKDE
jgi:hypothetical protein